MRMGIILDGLSKIDLFGSNLTFTMNRKKSFSSWHSGLLSLIFYILAVVYIAVQLNFWLTYQNNTYVSQINHIESPMLNFSNASDFMMAFCLSNNNNATVRDPDVMASLAVSLSWTFFVRNPWLIQNITIPIPTNTCQASDIPDSMKLRFNYGFYHDCYCANSANLRDYNMSFFFTDAYSAYLSMNVNWKPSVMNNETAYNYYYNSLKNLNPRVITYYIDYTADLELIEFSKFFNYHITYLNPDLTMQTDMFFNLLEMSVDQSFIGSNFKEFIGISFERANTWLLVKNNAQNFATKNPSLAGYRFKASNKKIVAKISTMKVDLFIGKITSFILVFYILLGIANNFINKLEIKRKMILCLFKNTEINHIMMKRLRDIQEKYNEVQYDDDPDFQIFDQKNLKGKHSTNKSTRNEKTKMNKFDIMIDKNDGASKNNNDPNVFDKDTKAYENIKHKENANKEFRKFGIISLTDYLTSSCRSKKNLDFKFKMENFWNASALIDFYMDGTIFLKKMMEIDIIKYFLFDKYQRKLITIISNPDQSSQNSKAIYERLDNEYDYQKFYEDQFVNQINNILPEVITKARNDPHINRLLAIVQKGNDMIHDY